MTAVQFIVAPSGDELAAMPQSECGRMAAPANSAALASAARRTPAINRPRSSWSTPSPDSSPMISLANVTRMRSAKATSSSSCAEISRIARAASRCRRISMRIASVAPISTPRVGWSKNKSLAGERAGRRRHQRRRLRRRFRTGVALGPRGGEAGRTTGRGGPGWPHIRSDRTGLGDGRGARGTGSR